MTRDDLKFRAALSRFGVVAVALALLPVFYPRTRAHLWVWGLYIAVASVEQVLIRRRIGGRVRPVLSGIFDTIILTYWVHRLGSIATPTMSVYFFASVANALVGDVRVGLIIAAFNALAYDAVVWAEWGHVLPFAPDAPAMAVLGPPPLSQAFLASIFVTAFVFASTAIVLMLVLAVQHHEEQLVRANARLEELSQRDPLTEIYNRRYLFERVQGELARVRRGHPFAILMIDLDRFKKINDIHGHLRGDALLKEIGTSIALTIRVTDVAGRYGGDEFLVLLPDTEAGDAQGVAERVAQSVHNAAAGFDPANPVTASGGIAVASSTDTVATLLRRADDNAYRAKQGGGNRVVA
jgi:diguanylate cyclase (GGDEF)-like protein